MVSNLGVFDFETPDHAMRLRSVHPGVSVDEVVGGHRLRAGHPRRRPHHAACPIADELELIREVLDPNRRDRESK